MIAFLRFQSLDGTVTVAAQRDNEQRIAYAFLQSRVYSPTSDHRFTINGVNTQPKYGIMSSRHRCHVFETVVQDPDAFEIEYVLTDTNFSVTGGFTLSHFVIEDGGIADAWRLWNEQSNTDVRNYTAGLWSIIHSTSDFESAAPNLTGFDNNNPDANSRVNNRSGINTYRFGNAAGVMNSTRQATLRSDWGMDTGQIAAMHLPGREITVTPPTGQVQNLAGSYNRSQKTINLTWTALPGATHYTLQRRRGGQPRWYNIVSRRTGTAWTDSSPAFDFDQTWEYRIRGYNNAGSGPWSAAATVETGPPVRPGNKQFLASAFARSLDDPREVDFSGVTNPAADRRLICITTINTQEQGGDGSPSSMTAVLQGVGPGTIIAEGSFPGLTGQASYRVWAWEFPTGDSGTIELGFDHGGGRDRPLCGPLGNMG